MVTSTEENRVQTYGGTMLFMETTIASELRLFQLEQSILEKTWIPFPEQRNSCYSTTRPEH
jgi:hypothetical protein